MATPVLTTSRYVQPGVYVGEILQPEASNLSADARIPAIIAVGSPLAVSNNIPIIRSFIYGAELAFSPVTPFVAALPHVAVGNKSLPNRIFQQDGTELQQQAWNYIADPTTGLFTGVQIRDDQFNQIATYYMDYQSSERGVLDPLPIPNIRLVTAIGNQVDRDQYQEFTDYYIPDTFSDVIPDAHNQNPTTAISPVTAYLQPGSTGQVSVDPAAQYTHPYDRNYTLTCTAISGVSPARTATFQWTSSASIGNDAAVGVPVGPGDAPPTFIVDETDLLSQTQTLQYGITLDLAFGLSQFVVGDQFTVSGLGASMLEVDSRYGNPQYATVFPAILEAGSAGDMQIEINPNTAYALLHNNTYQVKLVALSGTAPNRVFTYAWQRFGDQIAVSGGFVVQENNYLSHTVTIANGVIIQFVIGSTSPAVGSFWNIQAAAPRIYYTAKDSRQYKMTVGSVVNSGGVISILGSYSTNTTEGNFGEWQAAFNPTTGSPDGYFMMPDNVSLACRNCDQIAALDIFQFSITDDQVIDWSLNAKVTDVRQVTDYLTDVNGAITGTAGQKYVILTNIPSDPASIRVQDYNTGNDISFNFVINTPYVYFVVNPNVPLRITYVTNGAEPDPGQTYYISAQYVRPDSFYNTPFLVLRLADGRTFASPMVIGNDLYVANEVAWANNPPGVYLIQPKNQDGSGVYTIPDFQPAVDSMNSVPGITDVCLINFPDALPLVLEQNIVANDPFNRRPNLVWYGMPIGTPVGDENTSGSLVFTATRTLQTSNQSAALGTRILCGSVRATKSVLLSTGQNAVLTLDGSFIALAGACLVASFNDPATDMLNQLIAGFDSIDVWSAEENNILGGAQINYVNGSAGVYSWGEDYTVANIKNFNLVQLMTQRQFVTKVVIRNMAPLIGLVPGSNAAAKQLIRGQLASVLNGLLARGLIAPYQNDDGTERQFDPNTDILIFQDTADPTQFYFNYSWFSRNVIKRLFGLYALNSNDLNTGVVLT